MRLFLFDYQETIIVDLMTRFCNIQQRQHNLSLKEKLIILEKSLPNA